MKLMERVTHWAREIKRDAVALWFARRHPATPLPVKLLCIFIAAYALSPIDLIPDFIPVLGYIDDALLLPGLIWLALRWLPEDVLRECRAVGAKWLKLEGRRPGSLWGAGLVIVIWLTLSWLVWRYLIAPRCK
jgi:uncharacterized membrane protein YkvA (DUF1232 family)